jgi:hypothetical protein
LEVQVLGALWQRSDPWQAPKIDLPISPQAMFSEEARIFDQSIGSNELAPLVARYGIKNTRFRAGVAHALRFQNADDYPQAVCARLRTDDAARKTVIALFGDLPHALAEATDPERRAKRSSHGSENTTVGIGTEHDGTGSG